MMRRPPPRMPSVVIAVAAAALLLSSALVVVVTAQTAAVDRPAYSFCHDPTAHACPATGSDSSSSTPSPSPLCPGAGIGCAAGFFINSAAPNGYEVCCEGYYCPQALNCMAPCPNGAYCGLPPPFNSSGARDSCGLYKQDAIALPDGITVLCGGAGNPQDVPPCPAGYYCPDPGSAFLCPSGHFCPAGTVTPRACLPGTPCGEGTAQRPIEAGLVSGMVAASVGLTLLLLLLDRWFVVVGFSCKGFWDDYGTCCRRVRCIADPDDASRAADEAANKSPAAMRQKRDCVDRESCRAFWTHYCQCCGCGFPPTIRRKLVNVLPAVVPPHTCANCCYCCRVCCCLPGESLCCCSTGACSGEVGVVDMTDTDDPDAPKHTLVVNSADGTQRASTAESAVHGTAAGGQPIKKATRVSTDGDLPVRMVDQSEFNAHVAVECNHLDVAIKYPTLFHAQFALEPNTVNAILGPSGAGKSTMLIPLAHKYDTYFQELAAADAAAAAGAERSGAGDAAGDGNNSGQAKAVVAAAEDGCCDAWCCRCTRRCVGRFFSWLGVGGAGDVKLLTPDAVQYVVGRLGGKDEHRERFSAGREWNRLGERIAVGYVPQNDIMPRYLTIRECVEFSAWWRLPGMSPMERRLAVDNVLREMNFKPIDETKQIGTEDTGGISGGQRKRVNVAMELVANPHVLYLDEPTSGLDTVMSQKLMTVLKKRAAHGMTIALVVHQPRLEIWNQFSRVVLLRQLPKPTDPFYGHFFSVAVSDTPLNATTSIRQAVEEHPNIGPRVDRLTNNAADYCLDALACEGDGQWLDLDPADDGDDEQAVDNSAEQAADAAAAQAAADGKSPVEVAAAASEAHAAAASGDAKHSSGGDVALTVKPAITKPVSAAGPPSMTKPVSAQGLPSLARMASGGNLTTGRRRVTQTDYNAAIALAHAASGSTRYGAPFLEKQLTVANTTNHAAAVGHGALHLPRPDSAMRRPASGNASPALSRAGTKQRFNAPPAIDRVVSVPPPPPAPELDRTRSQTDGGGGGGAAAVAGTEMVKVTLMPEAGVAVPAPDVLATTAPAGSAAALAAALGAAGADGFSGGAAAGAAAAPYQPQAAAAAGDANGAAAGGVGAEAAQPPPRHLMEHKQISVGTAAVLRALAPDGPRQTVSYQTQREIEAHKKRSTGGGSSMHAAGGLLTAADADDVAVLRAAAGDMDVDARARMLSAAAVRHRKNTTTGAATGGDAHGVDTNGKPAADPEFPFDPAWIGRAGRGTRRPAPQIECGSQLSVFFVKELVRIIRAPDQFFFGCLMAMAASFLVGKLNPAPTFTGLPAVNVLSMMALAIIAAVQSVELYGDEADRLSFFRESARARGATFLPALFVAKQFTALFYLAFIPLVFTGVFQAMSDTTLAFGEYYSVAVVGYFVAQSYGQFLSVLVSPASKQLVGATSVLILCFLSGQNPTLPELGGFRVVADALSFTRYQCEMLVFLQSRALSDYFQPVAEKMAVAFDYQHSDARYARVGLYLFAQGMVARTLAFFIFLLKDRYKRFKS